MRIGQQAKVVAVAGVVVLALTGFSRHGSHSHSHSHGHYGSGGGGGCSGPAHTSSSSGSSSRSTYGSTTDTDTDTADDGTGDSYGSGSATPASGYRTRPTHQAATGSSQGAHTARATARSLACASPAAGGRKAVTSSKVEVTAARSNGSAATFEVDVVFKDAAGTSVDIGSASVRLAPGATRTVTVPMDTPSSVGTVATCEPSVV
ncbi:hypothetical protein AB0910_24765 [Streptomyces sp. NPDC047002]|uniref:hypothetical protein n=1 Tax=Streptomyces sp. NPDC047002 TaxID=3155475 RepID=UPI003451B7D4